MEKETKKNIYLMYGEDQYSAYEKINSWKKQFVSKYGELNLEEIKEKNVSLGKLQESILSFGMFSEKRMVALYNFFEQSSKDMQATFLELVDKIDGDLLLILVEQKNPDKRTSLYKKMVKIANVEEYKALKAGPLAKWIANRVQILGGSIDMSVAALIASMSDSNLYHLEKELEKVLLYNGYQPITEADVDASFIPHINTSIFKLTDKLNADRKVVIKLLDEVVDSSGEPMMVFYMIVRHFRLIMQVKPMVEKGMSAQDIARALKQPPFIVFNLVKQAKSLDMNRLASIYQQLCAIEIDIKSGNIKMLAGDTRGLAQRLKLVFV